MELTLEPQQRNDEAQERGVVACSALLGQFVDKLHRGDALEIMRSMPDGSVDCVITDPPYCSGSISEASRTAAKGQGLRSENLRRFGWFVGDNMGTAGLVWLIRSMAVESMRLLKGNGSLLIFCDWRMSVNLIPAVESAGLRYQNLIVWDKKHMGMGNGFRHRHELIMHMTAGSPEYYDKGTANVLTCPRVNAQDRDHQTQKPVELIAQLVRVICPPGGVVLDPFAGSCTTAQACAETGRHYVCIERDPDHCETGRQRLAATERDLYCPNTPGQRRP